MLLSLTALYSFEIRRNLLWAVNLKDEEFRVHISSACHRTDLFLWKKTQVLDWTKLCFRVQLTQSACWVQLFLGTVFTLRAGPGCNILNIFPKQRKQPDCPRKTIVSPEIPFHFDQNHLPVARGGSSAWKTESLILTNWTSFSLPVYSAFYPIGDLVSCSSFAIWDPERLKQLSQGHAALSMSWGNKELTHLTQKPWSYKMMTNNLSHTFPSQLRRCKVS